ncbi:SubName: Full=Uncharacterized protein {ECO:0000313/EMBL:CCA68774.1} [Serendipita indica DSM 11827]|nr:SubName: Full=Uncharacterized protein {ECO:0000313/EMBL:CCA68774.1} [Serendipita indica DSM 11827]
MKGKRLGLEGSRSLTGFEDDRSNVKECTNIDSHEACFTLSGSSNWADQVEEELYNDPNGAQANEKNVINDGSWVSSTSMNFAGVDYKFYKEGATRQVPQFSPKVDDRRYTYQDERTPETTSPESGPRTVPEKPAVSTTTFQAKHEQSGAILEWRQQPKRTQTWERAGPKSSSNSSQKSKINWRKHVQTSSSQKILPSYQYYETQACLDPMNVLLPSADRVLELQEPAEPVQDLWAAEKKKKKVMYY